MVIITLFLSAYVSWCAAAAAAAATCLLHSDCLAGFSHSACANNKTRVPEHNKGYLASLRGDPECGDYNLIPECSKTRASYNSTSFNSRFPVTTPCLRPALVAVYSNPRVVRFACIAASMHRYATQCIAVVMGVSDVRRRALVAKYVPECVHRPTVDLAEAEAVELEKTISLVRPREVMCQTYRTCLALQPAPSVTKLLCNPAVRLNHGIIDPTDLLMVGERWARLRV